MGVKRISRGKLLDTEKLGQSIDPGASPLMKNCIVSATQHREGYKVITDIVVDLGSSKQELISFGDESAQGDPLGAGTSVSYIATLSNSVFGAVTSVETICLEAFVGSGGALAGSGSIDLYHGDDGDGYLNNPDGDTPTAIVLDIGVATGCHRILAYDAASTLADQYVYFVLGNQGGTDVAKATATITVGGDAVIGTLVDEITRITLTDATGSLIHFTAEGGTAYNGSQAPFAFNFGSAASPANIATGIQLAINGQNSFIASVTDAEVTVTQSAAGENGNLSNYYTDAPSKTTNITVSDFTGGTTKGDALPITAGKFLLRFTGFMTPDDL
jgi:hypothetical protein